VKGMTLAQAVAAIRAMPPQERVAAVEALASTASGGPEGPGEGWKVFDPVECTPEVATRCDYRGGPGKGRICLVAIDERVGCPHAEYVP